MAAQGLLEASFSSNSVPNGLKLRAEKLNGRPQQVSVTTFYELPRVLASIRTHAASFVALQFPEAMLSDAPAVLWALESALEDGTDLDGQPMDDATASASAAPQGTTTEPPLLYVLGDTSYGEASVDEVAAAHLPTDLIVHFGPSTLAPAAGNVPVLHVFNQRPLSHPSAAASAIAAALTEASWAEPAEANVSPSGAATTAPVLPPLVLVYDAAYGAGASAVATCLREEHGIVVRLGVPPHPAEEQKTGRTVVAGGCAGNTASGSGTSGCCSGRIGDGGSSGGDGVGESGVDSKKSDCGETSCDSRSSDGMTALRVKKSSTEDECVLLIGGLEVKLAPRDSANYAGVGTDSHDPNTAASAAATDDEEEETEDRAEGLIASHAVCFLGSDGWQLDSVLMRCEMARHCLVLDPEVPAAPVAAALTSAASATRTTAGDIAAAPDSTAALDMPPISPPVYECVLAKAVSGALRRRFYQVARCRDASVMGVVVGTLGVRHYREVVARVVKLIEGSGRKAYVLALGTPNVAKLTNFPEIDAFVLVASPETALLDARDFPSPVVTPLELEVALGLRAWNGNYSTDFSDLLRDAPPPPSPPPPDSLSSSSVDATLQAQAGSEANGAAIGGQIIPALGAQSRGAAGIGAKGSSANAFQDDEDAPTFSLVTSKLEDSRRLRGKGSSTQSPQRGEKVSLAFENTESGDSNNSANNTGSSHSSRALATYHSPAAEFLASRSYQGLEQRLGEDAPHLAVQGRSGTASGYGDEGHFTAPAVQPIAAALSIEQDKSKSEDSGAGTADTDTSAAAAAALAAMNVNGAAKQNGVPNSAVARVVAEDDKARGDDGDSAGEEDTGASAGGALENFLAGFDSD